MNDDEEGEDDDGLQWPYKSYRPITGVRIRRNFFHCNHDRSTYRPMSLEQFSFLLEWLAVYESIDEVPHNLVHLILNNIE